MKLITKLENSFYLCDTVVFIEPAISANFTIWRQSVLGEFLLGNSPGEVPLLQLTLTLTLL